MIFYFVLLLIVCTILYAFDSKEGNILSFLVLLVVSALRENGADFRAYELIYNMAYTTPWSRLFDDSIDFIGGLEPGFLIFTKLAASTGLGYRYYLLITSAVILYGVYRFIDGYSVDRAFSIWLYICFGWYTTSFTAIRQYLAMAFVLLSLIEYQNKRSVRTVILMAFAVTFHLSSIICIVFLGFNRIKVTRNKINLTLFLFPVFYLAVCCSWEWMSRIVSRFSSRYGSFFQQEAVGTGRGGKFILYMAFFIFIAATVFFNRSRISFLNERVGVRSAYFGIRLELYLITLLVFTEIAIFALPIGRLAWYMEIPMALLIPNVVNCYYSGSNRKILTVALLAVSALLFVYFVNGDMNVATYRIWQGD